VNLPVRALATGAKADQFAITIVSSARTAPAVFQPCRTTGRYPNASVCLAAQPLVQRV